MNEEAMNYAVCLLMKSTLGPWLALLCSNSESLQWSVPYSVAAVGLVFYAWRNGYRCLCWFDLLRCPSSFLLDMVLGFVNGSGLLIQLHVSLDCKPNDGKLRPFYDTYFCFTKLPRGGNRTNSTLVFVCQAWPTWCQSCQVRMTHASIMLG